MSNVLLTPNTILQLAAKEPNPTKARIAGIPPSQLQPSYLSIAIARASVRAIFPPALHTQWLNAIQDVVRGIRRHSGEAPLETDENVLNTWESIRDHVFGAAGETADNDTLGQDMRLVIATALHHRLIWMEPLEAYHAGLRAVGLDVESI